MPPMKQTSACHWPSCSLINWMQNWLSWGSLVDWRGLDPTLKLRWVYRWTEIDLWEFLKWIIYANCIFFLLGHEIHSKSLLRLVYCCCQQVTVEYRVEHGATVPVRVHTVVISVQHDEHVTLEQLRSDLMEKVIRPVIPAKYLDQDTIYHLQPSGRFIIGGPQVSFFFMQIVHCSFFCILYSSLSYCRLICIIILSLSYLHHRPLQIY